MKKYRVIIWGMGSVGRYAVKMIQGKKFLDLVGAIDTDPMKTGRDAGELFGFSSTGVIISDDIDQVLELEADVVLLYLPTIYEKGNMRPSGYRPMAENICRALKAKKNVLTPLPTYHLHKTAPAIYEMINQCAIENGVTFVQQGIFPASITLTCRWSWLYGRKGGPGNHYRGKMMLIMPHPGYGCSVMERIQPSLTARG